MARLWPLGIVLVAQVGILAIVPARHVRARVSGTRITLRTVPFDPYDVMSGYYVRLSYEVEEKARRAGLEDLEKRDLAWIEVRRAEPAWEFVAVTRDRPAGRADTVALPARWTGGRFEIVGARRLYIPESQRERADEAAGRALVDARVGSDGTVALIRMRFGELTFGD
ncbi:MAG: GDYXXLXY domain-containing protein [Planctomycetota bacterium]|nr:GDYXXLXY domain-containing protein [Planctomycetota bacterium]